MFPIAHAGHWAISLLYLAPVVILVGALALARRRDRQFDDDDLEGDVYADGAFDDDLSSRR